MNLPNSMTVSEQSEKCPGSENNHVKEAQMRRQMNARACLCSAQAGFQQSGCFEDIFFDTTLIIKGALEMTVHAIFDGVERSLCNRNS
jgi:hypothetical protein